MANRPEHRERSESNGLAKDINLQSAANHLEHHPTLQGYLLLGLGTVLVLFSLGFFPILKWAIFAGGVALGIWGASRSHLIEGLGNLFESIRKRF